MSWMQSLTYLRRVAPRVPLYWLYRARLLAAPQPLVLSFAITNRCQSRCCTCNIWKLYQDHPERAETELRLDEIERLFASMQPVLLLNVVGGEPTLRDDLPAICELAARHLRPSIIHMPTNCLAPSKIEHQVREILKRIPTSTKLTVKLSLDGIGEQHDRIRGVPGNFDRLRQTHDRLVQVREQYPNFYLDAGITVSRSNIAYVGETVQWVRTHLELDNLLHEVADNRSEMHNPDLVVQPSGKDYDAVLEELDRDARASMRGARFLPRMTQALRLVYYRRAAKRLKTNRRDGFCYAGVTNVYLTPQGNVWLCLSFDHVMGNVREYDYDFRSLWRSLQARQARDWVRADHCACPVVGQAFLDTMLSPVQAVKVLWCFMRGSMSHGATTQGR